MSLAEQLPTPEADWDVLKPHWQAARRHEFRLPRCLSCQLFNWYPDIQCRRCDGLEFEWALLSGRGTLFSWAVVHRGLYAPLLPLVPYVSALMEIQEDPAVRYVTRILTEDTASLAIGAPLEVIFEDFGYPVSRREFIGIFAKLLTVVSPAISKNPERKSRK